MRAKKINENFSDILSPKSKKEIQKELEKLYIQLGISANNNFIFFAVTETHGNNTYILTSGTNKDIKDILETYNIEFSYHSKFGIWGINKDKEIVLLKNDEECDYEYPNIKKIESFLIKNIIGNRWQIGNLHDDWDNIIKALNKYNGFKY